MSYFQNNVSKVCILMVFVTISNCREKIKNNVSKTYIVRVFEMIGKCRKHFANIVSKACILTAVETAELGTWNCREID